MQSFCVLFDSILLLLFEARSLRCKNLLSTRTERSSALHLYPGIQRLITLWHVSACLHQAKWFVDLLVQFLHFREPWASGPLELRCRPCLQELLLAVLQLQRFCCSRRDLYAGNYGLHKLQSFFCLMLIMLFMLFMLFMVFLALTVFIVLMRFTSIAALNALPAFSDPSVQKASRKKYRSATSVRAFPRAFSKWSVGASLATLPTVLELQNVCCLRHDRFYARNCGLHKLQSFFVTYIAKFNAFCRAFFYTKVTPPVRGSVTKVTSLVRGSWLWSNPFPDPPAQKAIFWISTCLSSSYISMSLEQVVSRSSVANLLYGASACSLRTATFLHVAVLSFYIIAVWGTIASTQEIADNTHCKVFVFAVQSFCFCILAVRPFRFFLIFV